MINHSNFFGIVNVTPDSFSDGGEYFSPADAIQHGMNLFSDGVDILDIGADSTRPGSICVGHEEEWQRLEPVLKIVAPIGITSVDTHNLKTAEKAIKLGVKIINDISGGSEEMFSLVAKAKVRYVLMYTKTKNAHQFEDQEKCSADEVLENIVTFFRETLREISRYDISEKQLILDPSLGRFLSSNPENSWHILKNIQVLQEFGLPILLGISRKGFVGGSNTQEKDTLSAIAALEVAKFAYSEPRLFFRVHNARVHHAVWGV